MIKLRAFDKKDEVMMYSDTSENTFILFNDKWSVQYLESYNTVINGENVEQDRLETCTELVIMECTDRKDKNGKFIYEGDVFGNIWQLRCQVKKLQDGQFVLIFLDTRIKPISILDHKIGKSPIIGNIYEHPELLTDNQNIPSNK